MFFALLFLILFALMGYFFPAWSLPMMALAALGAVVVIRLAFALAGRGRTPPPSP